MKAIADSIMKKKSAKTGDDDGGDEYTVSASNILDAIKNDDAEGLAAELKNFCEMCAADSASPDEDALAAE